MMNERFVKKVIVNTCLFFTRLTVNDLNISKLDLEAFRLVDFFYQTDESDFTEIKKYVHSFFYCGFSS